MPRHKTASLLGLITLEKVEVKLMSRPVLKAHATSRVKEACFVYGMILYWEHSWSGEGKTSLGQLYLLTCTVTASYGNIVTGREYTKFNL